MRDYAADLKHLIAEHLELQQEYAKVRQQLVERCLERGPMSPVSDLSSIPELEPDTGSSVHSEREVCSSMIHRKLIGMTIRILCVLIFFGKLHCNIAMIWFLRLADNHQIEAKSGRCGDGSIQTRSSEASGGTSSDAETLLESNHPQRSA